jgi:integrase/recombinase XerD
MVLVRGFFRWLVRQDVLSANPASDLELPRKPKPLPRNVLTISEAEAMLAVPDVTTLLGLRDRAILELLYSAGLRRNELACLGIHDVDPGRGLVHVRFGKGNKERLVPCGERALYWIDRYVTEVRPRLLLGDDAGILFLSQYGTSLLPDSITVLAKKALAESGVAKTGACHVLRHTMATLMLEGGADIRHVQEMLGHANLDTTQIYTHVAVHKLCEVHARTHPGAQLRPVPSSPRSASE